MAAQPSPTSYDAAPSQTLRCKKHLKLVAFIVLLIVFLAAIITILDRTVLKIRSPKYKLTTINIENLAVNNSTNSPSFSMDLETEIAFRNRNFGPYNFEFGYLTFSYIGTRVGDAVVESSKVKMYSSKTVNLKVKINSKSVKEKSNLGKDIGNGRLMLKVDSELRGQVGLMKVFKNDRGVKLNCSFVVDLARKLVKELNCD